MRKLPFVNKRAGRRSAVGNAGCRPLKRQGAQLEKAEAKKSNPGGLTTRPAASNALGHVRLKNNVSVFDGPVIARLSIRLGLRTSGSTRRDFECQAFEILHARAV
jgi:hypothetical protein